MDYMIDNLKNVKVVIFGTGDKSKYAIEYLLENNIKALYFVDDNNEIKTMQIIDNKQIEHKFIVYNPEVLFDEDKANLAVVITTDYSSYPMIKSRLTEMGIKYYFYSKDIITCDLLQHKIGFYNEQIGFCCAADKKNINYLPYFPYLNTVEETIVSFLQTREAIFKGLNNIGDVQIAKFCKDCCRLRTIKNHISDIGYGLEKISIFNISCYPSICQAKCIYCNVPDERVNSYELASQSRYPKMITEIIIYLQKNNLLENNCYFQFAPAEITITPFREALLDATKKYKSSFCTNGFLFDQQIADSLRNNNSFVYISLDCGTRETFKIIKGRDLFDKVEKNLINYRRNGEVILKYNILPGINDGDKDIVGTINILKELNLRFINLSHDYDLPLRTAFYGIVKFAKLLEENNLIFYFHAKQYTTEQTKRIIDEHWNCELEKYCKDKSYNLSIFFNTNNDYEKYRNYVYETEIKDLFSYFIKETRFSIFGNKKCYKNQMILSSFQKFGIIPPQIKFSEETLNELNCNTDIFIILDSNEISDSIFLENIKQTQRALYIENYFNSLVPAKSYLEKTISIKYLKCYEEQVYHDNCLSHKKSVISPHFFINNTSQLFKKGLLSLKHEGIRVTVKKVTNYLVKK